MGGEFLPATLLSRCHMLGQNLEPERVVAGGNCDERDTEHMYDDRITDGLVIGIHMPVGIEILWLA